MLHLSATEEGRRLLTRPLAQTVQWCKEASLRAAIVSDGASKEASKDTSRYQALFGLHVAITFDVNVECSDSSPCAGDNFCIHCI